MLEQIPNTPPEGPVIQAARCEFDDPPTVPRGLTVAEYAKAKRLPEEFLREKFHLKDTDGAVEMPYLFADGSFFRSKLRPSMDKDAHKMFWSGEKGPIKVPYGVWLISPTVKSVMIVEGESDTQTLHFHGLPGLGMPGANSWKNEFADLPFFQSAETVYVVQEPGQGGIDFVRAVAGSKLQPKLRIVTLPEKDISALHLSTDKDRFISALKNAVRIAKPVSRPTKTAAKDAGEPLEILETGRNIGLTRIAGRMWRAGVTPEALELALLQKNDDLCKPPLDREEVVQIAQSISRYPQPAEKSVPEPVKASPAPQSEKNSTEGSTNTNTDSTADIRTDVNKEASAVQVKEVKPNPQSRKKQEPVPEISRVVGIPDMSTDVLDGRLGELCQRYMLKDNRFPVAYAWPSIITAASALLPYGVQVNCYNGLVGDVGTGKTQADEYAKAIVGLPEADANEPSQGPAWAQIMAGSAESLFSEIPKRFGGRTGLISLDEWSHLFAKAAIDRSSFSMMLCTAFNKPRFQMLIAGGKKIWVEHRLSFSGGIVTQNFEDCFGSNTIGGLYDRFTFGLCPTGYIHYYQPCEDTVPPLNFAPVTINRDVWDMVAEWRRRKPELGRTVELAIRAKIVCASADGVRELKASMFGFNPPQVFAEYQTWVRTILRPNVGDNPDAKCGSAIKNWLNLFAPDGLWKSLTDLKRGVHYDRFGAGVFSRCLDNMVRMGDIEMTRTSATPKGGRKENLVRLLNWTEPEEQKQAGASTTL